MDKKPALAILIGQALAKKGIGKGAPAEEEDKDEGSYDSSEDADQHLQEIADDLIQAIHGKDSQAVADLLKEAFECLSAPHEEE